MTSKNEYKLSEHLDGFIYPKTDFTKYESSFRRWLIMQIDRGYLTFEEARDRFDIPKESYRRLIVLWQKRYSVIIHSKLDYMSSEDRVAIEALEAKIEELEKKLENAQDMNLALNTLIDVAEEDLKIDIRKKAGPDQSK